MPWRDLEILGSSLKVIVVNDEATLRALTKQPYTLAQVRGSVYDFHGIPVLIFDNFKTMHAQIHGKFTFGLDLRKMVRYAKEQRQQEPSFNYTLCRTVGDVKFHCERARQANLIAEDIETRVGIIASIAFSYDFGGALNTFTIPFIDPNRESYRESEDNFSGR